MKMSRLLSMLFGIVTSVGIGAWAHSAVIYTYTGNSFNAFTDNTPPAGSYTAANSVMGWFELDTALGNNLALASVTALAGFDFLFTDGRKTVTSSSSGLIINQFQVGTDASGNIDEWLIAVGFPANPNIVGSQSATIQSDGETSINGALQDRGAINEVTVAGVPGQTQPQFLQDAGSIRNNPGTWERSSVPEPATLALLGLGLVGLAASRRRKQ